jgi:hypothetical protein
MPYGRGMGLGRFYGRNPGWGRHQVPAQAPAVGRPTTQLGPPTAVPIGAAPAPQPLGGPTLLGPPTAVPIGEAPAPQPLGGPTLLGSPTAVPIGEAPAPLNIALSNPGSGTPVQGTQVTSQVPFARTGPMVSRPVNVAPTRAAAPNLAGLIGRPRLGRYFG